MIKLAEAEKCCGCSACYSICPVSCINMEYDNEGFLYPVINTKKCIECKSCINVCPALITESRNVKNDTAYPAAYAAYNHDKDIRLNSSSGGIFMLIADYILEKGGVIFGAAFNNDMQVIHICADNMEDVRRLCTSKYVQSNISDSYIEAKKYLNEDRWVLYTGTPCQISGLKSYLKKDYDKLICQDIICHGVPSPGIWKKYINYIRQKTGANITYVNFRSKNKGWKNYHFNIKLNNGQIYDTPHQKNTYMRLFLKNIILRPSCYSCHYKGYKREADITLADFWGINNILPEMDDDTGTSLIYIHSKKGELIWSAVKQSVRYKATDVIAATKYNPSMLYSPKKPIVRKKFFAKVTDKNIRFLAAIYNYIALLERIIRRFIRH